MNIDIYNLMAIHICEFLGNMKPSKHQIDLIEKILIASNNRILQQICLLNVDSPQQGKSIFDLLMQYLNPIKMRGTYA